MIKRVSDRLVDRVGRIVERKRKKMGYKEDAREIIS